MHKQASLSWSELMDKKTPVPAQRLFFSPSNRQCIINNVTLDNWSPILAYGCFIAREIKEQAEAEVVPSSSLVEVGAEVAVKVEVGVEVWV